MGHLSNGFEYKSRTDIASGLGQADLPDRLPWQVAASLIISLSIALWAGLGLLAERVFG